MTSQEDLTTARAYGRWLEDQDKTEWPLLLLCLTSFALRAREHKERPASEQCEHLTRENERIIAAADAAHATHVANKGT